MRGIETHQCPAYQPPSIYSNNGTGLTLGVRSRSDVDYGRELVSLTASDVDMIYWSPDGWCEKPKVDLFVSDCHSLRLLISKSTMLRHTITSCHRMEM